MGGPLSQVHLTQYPFLKPVLRAHCATNHTEMGEGEEATWNSDRQVCSGGERAAGRTEATLDEKAPWRHSGPRARLVCGLSRLLPKTGSAGVPGFSKHSGAARPQEGPLASSLPLAVHGGGVEERMPAEFRDPHFQRHMLLYQQDRTGGQEVASPELGIFK